MAGARLWMAERVGRQFRSHILATMAAGFLATAAHADPCKAIPDRGPWPSHLKPGTVIDGPVTYVGDGDSLCVAIGRGSQGWVEIRLSDFYAPELSAPGGKQAKAALERLVMNRRLICTIEHRSYDRAVSRCERRGVSVGDLLRRNGGQEGGRR